MYQNHIKNWNEYYNKLGLGISWGYKKPDNHIVDYFSFYNFKKNLNVLDSGCGYGKNSKYIIQKGFDLTGLDCSSDVIKYCKNKIFGGNFILGDIITYNFDINFDIIIDAGCFHVINPKISIKVIKKYHNLLNEGGYLFIRVFANKEKYFLIDDFLPVFNYLKIDFLNLIEPYFKVDKIILDTEYSNEDKIYYYYLRKK